MLIAIHNAQHFGDNIQCLLQFIMLNILPNKSKLCLYTSQNCYCMKINYSHLKDDCNKAYKWIIWDKYLNFKMKIILLLNKIF